MDKKWKGQNRKGYLKIHLTSDIKSKKILSIEVITSEHVHDNKVLPLLVNNIRKVGFVLDQVLGDGRAYDGNCTFRFLDLLHN